MESIVLNPHEDFQRFILNLLINRRPRDNVRDLQMINKLFFRLLKEFCTIFKNSDIRKQVDIGLEYYHQRLMLTWKSHVSFSF